jgi:hypothetical protein
MNWRKGSSRGGWDCSRPLTIWLTPQATGTITRGWAWSGGRLGHWHHLTPDNAGEIARHLAGLRSTHHEDDDDTIRFDPMPLVDSPDFAFQRTREQV